MCWCPNWRGDAEIPISTAFCVWAARSPPAPGSTDPLWCSGSAVHSPGWTAPFLAGRGRENKKKGGEMRRSGQKGKRDMKIWQLDMREKIGEFIRRGKNSTIDYLLSKIYIRRQIKHIKKFKTEIQKSSIHCIHTHTHTHTLNPFDQWYETREVDQASCHRQRQNHPFHLAFNGFFKQH